MSETTDTLHILLASGKQMHQRVFDMLEGLAADRAALAQEREKLAREAADFYRTLPVAVRNAVQDSMAGHEPLLSAQAERAFAPTFDKLSGVLKTAQEAETVLQRVIRWAGTRMFAWGITSIVALASIVCLSLNGLVRWDSAKVTALQARTTELEAQNAELESNSKDWVKTGAVSKLTNCGTPDRLCVPVDLSAGRFHNSQGDYYIIKGY